MSPSPQSAACPVCTSERTRPSYTVGDYGLANCLTCGHLFVGHGLRAEALAAAYDHDYYEASNPSNPTGYLDYLANAEHRLSDFRARIAAIERHHRDPRRQLLDFGCAVGLFVKAAQDAGWDAVGYERSAWAAQYGRDKLGVRIVVGDGGERLPFEEPFDVVTIWDALEHLEQPRTVLAELSRLVRPGGLLCLNTVDASSLGARLAGRHWRHIAPPHHLQYFSRQSLRHLVESAGFGIVDLEANGVMLAADRRRTHLGGAGRMLESMVTSWRARPAARLFDLLDEVEILAVKR